MELQSEISTLVRRRLLHIDLTKVSLHQGFLVVACLRKRQRRTQLLRAFLCAMDMAHPISLRPWCMDPERWWITGKEMRQSRCLRTFRLWSNGPRLFALLKVSKAWKSKERASVSSWPNHMWTRRWSLTWAFWWDDSKGNCQIAPRHRGRSSRRFASVATSCRWRPVDTKEPSSDGLAMASFGFLCTSLWVTGKVTMIGDPLSVSVW